MSSEIIAVGHITVADLRDALVSGDPPVNPEDGQLWIDSNGSKSVLKVWRNGRWEAQPLDIENLDPDLSETVKSILSTLGSMADDGQLDFANRSTLAMEIAEIIGSTPSRASGNVYTNSLPDYTVLDSQGVGSFASVRRTYRDVDGDTSASEYIALQQAYTELNSYLSGHSLKPWDVTRANRDRVVEITDPDLFREYFLEYFLAELALSSENERLAIKRAEEYTERLTDGSSVVDKGTVDGKGGDGVFSEISDDSVVHVEMDGKSYQATDPDNLFDIAEWFRVPDSEKPTSTGVPYISLSLEPNTEYTISTNIPDRTNGTAYDVFALVGGDNASSGRNGLSDNNHREVVTASDGILRVAMRDYRLTKDDGYWIKVEKGAESTPFKGYSIPTPDYPIDIHSVNNVDVVSSIGGRNLLRNSNFSNGLGPWETSGHLDGNTITLPPNTFLLMRSFIDLENLIGYKFIAVARVRGNGLFRAHMDGVAHMWTAASNDWQTYRFEHIGATNRSFAVRTNADSQIEIEWVKLVKGNKTSLDWTPAPEDVDYDTLQDGLYKTNLLLGEPLRSVGDVCDRLMNKNGIWVIERNIGEVIFDGSERWSMGNGSQFGDGRRFQTTVPDSLSTRSRQYILSSHFGQQDFTGGNDLVDRAFQHGSRIFIYPSSSIATSVAELQTWLSSNNVTFYYLLDQPTIETLDQEFQDKLNNIRSFQGSNYVYIILN